MYRYLSMADHSLSRRTAGFASPPELRSRQADLSTPRRPPQPFWRPPLLRRRGICFLLRPPPLSPPSASAFFARCRFRRFGLLLFAQLLLLSPLRPRFFASAAVFAASARFLLRVRRRFYRLGSASSRPSPPPPRPPLRVCRRCRFFSACCCCRASFARFFSLLCCS